MELNDDKPDLDMHGGRQLWSISSLAREFCRDRETVRKRIAAACVQPAGQRSGHPVFLLADVAATLVYGHGAGDGFDPRQLAPSDRNLWFQSENRRIDLEMKCRQLIPAEECRAEFAEFAMTHLQFVVTLPDQLERDMGLTPEQVDLIGVLIERHRVALHARLSEASE